MAEEKRPTIQEEAGLPSNWEPIDVAPIIPSQLQTPANSSGTSAPYVGSLPPSFQQNVDFAATARGGGNLPNLSLMPLGIQGNPSTNAAITSTAIKSVIVPPAAPQIPQIIEILSNVQVGTSYTVQTSDLDTLISMTNNAGGTVILPGPGSPFSFVQFKDFSGASHSQSVTFTNTAGNFMYLSVWIGVGLPGGLSVSDTNGNTWTLVDSTNDGGATGTANYYAPNIKGGSNTLTVSFVGGAAVMNAVVMEYSGISPAAPLDVHAFTLSGAGTTITTGFNNDLVIYSCPEADTETAAAPWTARYNTPSSFSGFQFGQDQIVASSGTVVNTLGATAPGVPNNFTQFIAAFKTAIAAPATGFEAGFFTYIENTGTGTFTVESTAQIDGSIQTFTLGPNQGVLVVYDGANWWTERGIGVPLPVGIGNGGTGRSTLTAHNVLLGEGTSPVGFAAPGTSGLPLASNGAAADPSFQTISAAIGLSNGASGTGAVILANGATFTGNPTFASQTGSGAVVLAVSPTLTGTAALPIITLSGKVTNYNSVATVSNGVPAEYATIDLTAQSANLGPSTLYAVPASGQGLYRVSAYVVLTTAGSISSVLPNVQIVYTDPDTNTSITIDATPILGVAGIGQTGALSANTVGTAASGVIVVSVKLSTTIQYQTVNYASVAAGMQYAIHLKLEAL